MKKKRLGPKDVKHALAWLGDVADPDYKDDARALKTLRACVDAAIALSQIEDLIKAENLLKL